MIDNETLRKIEQARDLLTEVREALKDYGARIPASSGWADPKLSEKLEQVGEQQSAVHSVNQVLKEVPLALADVKTIWERLGKPEAPARTHITWKDGPFASIRGIVGGVEVLTISWHTRREDPDYFLRSDLPGIETTQARDDDPERLKAIAEERYAAWLARMSGNDSGG
jgi:hypothetical protein